MDIPASPINPGSTVTGKISWFGGPGDPSAGSATASGKSTSVPGIATYNRATLGGYFLVTAPNGRRAVLQQTDLGPAPWTGRAIDFTYSSLGALGYHQGNFPTDAVAHAQYLGKTVPGQYRSLMVGQGGQASQPQSSLGAPAAKLATTPGQTISTTTQVPDQAAYQAAVGRSIAGNYLSGQKDPYAAGAPKTGLASAGNPLLSSGLLTTGAPNPADYMKAQTTLQQIAGHTVPVAAHPGATGTSMLKGGYVNPLPGSTFTRTDQGVDGTGKTFLAPADSRILVADSHNAGWKGGGYIAGQILSGPDKGKIWYAAEGLMPTVRVGQTIGAGTRIATPVSNPYNGIVGNYEWGWAAPNATQPLAQMPGQGGYSEGQQTGAGKAFRDWINSLGATAGPSHS